MKRSAAGARVTRRPSKCFTNPRSVHPPTLPSTLRTPTFSSSSQPPTHPPTLQEVSYEELLKVFWERVDPLMENGQGNDRGTQYRTGIYTHSPSQLATAQASLAAEHLKHGSRPIMTELKPATVFW